MIERMVHLRQLGFTPYISLTFKLSTFNLLSDLSSQVDDRTRMESPLREDKILVGKIDVPMSMFVLDGQSGTSGRLHF